MTVERTAVETVVDDGLTIPLFRPGIVMSDQRSAQGSPGHLFLFNPRLPYTADRHRYSSAAEPNPSAGWHASVPFMNIEVRRGMVSTPAARLAIQAIKVTRLPTEPSLLENHIFLDYSLCPCSGTQSCIHMF
ncbi:uncharacterized protein CIMG_10583 [Coccidioides immitis RS]|uniref:Uncharacterized protein n=1 Tax=Coccidioides immitis (strain RS) TaxID=246410 RepID=A0A0D8JVI8_COCIM|nr:uncharacterized protein CIMG_10583 [Coccidioides immitis RS]KJF60293.1 hypothetical protein CIMG_10583 [Coccidioides immitis RS]